MEAEALGTNIETNNKNQKQKKKKEKDIVVLIVSCLKRLVLGGSDWGLLLLFLFYFRLFCYQLNAREERPLYEMANILFIAYSSPLGIFERDNFV